MCLVGQRSKKSKGPSTVLLLLGLMMWLLWVMLILVAVSRMMATLTAIANETLGGGGVEGVQFRSEGSEIGAVVQYGSKSGSILFLE